MDVRLAAGVARTEITPPPGIAHANCGAQSHERAAGVDRPLFAKALALGEDEPAVVVDLDVLYLWPSDARRIRSTAADLANVPESHVRLSYTHTHSGPTLNRETWADGGTEMIEPYLDALEQYVAGVTWQAVREHEPAQLAVGIATCDIAVNRRFRRPEDDEIIIGRNPDGPVDNEVYVLRIDADDNPLAAVVNYACHPITVGPDNDRITPDFPGVAKETVETATGSTCFYPQGAAGDVGPVRGVARGGIDEYEALGRRLGHAIGHTWWRLDPQERRERYTETLPSGAPLAVYETVYPDPEPRPVAVATEEISLPVRDLPTPAEARAEYERSADRLAELRSDNAPAEAIQNAAKDARQAEIRFGVAARFAGQENESIEAQVITVGSDVALVSIPGEPFVQVQQALKQRSPFAHTLVSGYSNAGIAYLSTADAYEEGGYEVEVTPFAPGAAEHAIDELVAILHSEAQAISQD